MESIRTSGRRISRIVPALAFVACVVACTSNQREGDACHDDADCRRELHCAGPNDPPVCGIPPRERCATDADCFAGGRCHALADPCSPDGIGSDCAPACTSGSCGDGFRCNGGGSCEPIPCDEGFACPMRQRCDPAVAHASGPVHARATGCVDIDCADDGDCPGGTACVDGICQDGPGVCHETRIVP